MRIIISAGKMRVTNCEPRVLLGNRSAFVIRQVVFANADFLLSQSQNSDIKPQTFLSTLQMPNPQPMKFLILPANHFFVWSREFFCMLCANHMRIPLSKNKFTITNVVDQGKWFEFLSIAISILCAMDAFVLVQHASVAQANIGYLPWAGAHGYPYLAPTEHWF